MDKISQAYLLCSYTPGLGPMKMQIIESKLPDLTMLLGASQQVLAGLIGQELATTIVITRESLDLTNIIQDLQTQNITYIAKSDPRYSAHLQNISDAPIGIFVKGNVTLLSSNTPKIAVVGTRKTSQYGISATSLLLSQMISHKPIIISGMAIGIDSVAHMEALRLGYPTIAVLGCGVNVIYPRENVALYEKIIKSGGAIISEFTPNQTVTRGLFVNRNRIISALSDKVIIVEGQHKSGSMITAKYALDQGKDVFAVPGPITSINSEGTNELIKNGATPLLHGNQLFESSGPVLDIDFDQILSSLEEVEKKVVQALQKESLSSDELGMLLELDSSKLSHVITKLELHDIVQVGSLGKISLKFG